MRETLYLRLGESPDAEVEFGVASTDLRSLQTFRGRLSEAAKQSDGRRVVAFLPAAEVHLASVELPGRVNARLLQAVPYALEDQLAEDVDSLHFAVGERLADGRIPVAVIAHDALTAWRQALAAHGLRVDVLVPEMLALPLPSAPGITALVTGRDAIARLPGHAGFACDADELETYLSLEEIDASAPMELFIARGAGGDWSRRGPSTHLKPAPSGLHVLVNGLNAATSINLLQGAYSEREGLQKHFRPWALAASLLLAWLLITVIGLGIESAKLGAELNRLDQANIDRYQQIFPDEQRIANLEAQLEQKIRGLSGSSADGPLPLLESVARALAATPDLKITAMQYRDRSLYLSLSAKDLQALESLRAWYAKQGDAQLEVQSANAESDGAKIRARVSSV